jgi:hypothetical protein
LHGESVFSSPEPTGEYPDEYPVAAVAVEVTNAQKLGTMLPSVAGKRCYRVLLGSLCACFTNSARILDLMILGSAGQTMKPDKAASGARRGAKETRQN